jgi:hypothetical protein
VTWIRNLLAAIASVTGMLLALPVLLLGTPFWIVGALTHWLTPVLSPRVVRWTELFEFDAALGWRAKPNLDGHCLEDRSDVFHIATDSHGWPGKSSLADSQLVVLGDSHAFGYGVDHEAAFFSLLNTDVRTKAVGVPGYNLVHQILLMERLAPQLRGKLVALFIYTGNDLHESLLPEMSGYRTPFVRSANGCSNWQVVTTHLSLAKWTASAGSSPQNIFPILDALHHETFLAERVYSACGFLLKEARRVSREAGFPLIILSIPPPFLLTGPDGKSVSPYVGHFRKPIDADFPDRKIGLTCRNLDIPFIPLKQHLNLFDYWEHDDHWTEGGHRKVAAVLRDVYRRYGVPSTSSST